MKKLMILLLLLTLSLRMYASAGVRVNTGTICSDIQGVFYAYIGSTLVGVTQAISLPSGINKDYLYSDFTWTVDPGPWDGATNNWSITAADIFDCVGSQSSSALPCGVYDFVSTVANGPAACFDYSTTCGACGTASPSVLISFTGGGPLTSLTVNQ